MAMYNGKKVLSVVFVTPAGYYPKDYFSFDVEEVNGENHLIMSYCGDNPPEFSIDSNGHLIYDGTDILDLFLDQNTKHLYWNL